MRREARTVAVRRRPLLAGAVGGLAGLAGCSALFPDASPEGGPRNATRNASNASDLPYRAENGSENVETPVGAKLDNATADETYVTLVVSKARPPAPGGESAFAAPQPFEAGETLFAKSAEIPGAGAETFYGLIAARGVYHAAVHVEGGPRGAIGLVVPGPAPTVQIRKRTVDAAGRPSMGWTPGRAPFPAEGEAKELPYAGSGPPLTTTESPSGGPSFVWAHNPTDRWQPFRLRIADGETTVLDYRYAVPPDVGLSLTPVGTAGPFAVTLGAGSEATTFEWRPKRRRALPLRLDGGAKRVGGRR